MNIHFIGICGSSMSVLADMCRASNHLVTGYDTKLNSDYNFTNVDNADIIVYTTAVGLDNSELIYAKSKGKKIYERAEFLSYICKDYKNVIAVSGTHGKTSTCAMMSYVFKNLDTTSHFGGECSVELNSGKDYFITEACEFNRSFLFLNPSVGVVLNMEYDHPDTYDSEICYSNAFKKFMAKSEKCVVFGDDKRLKSIAKKLGHITFGLESSNTFYASDINYFDGKTTFNVYSGGKMVCDILLNVTGEHNVLNALACVSVANLYGVSIVDVQSALKEFTPVKRRFERLGSVNKVVVITDYAHHPTEIAYSIASARTLNCDKIIAIFEPHTYSRTKALASGFASSLSSVDEIALMPIYPAREKPIHNVTSKLIADELALIGKPCNIFNSYSSLYKYLELLNNKDNCVVLFIGAGEIDEYARAFVHLYK